MSLQIGRKIIHAARRPSKWAVGGDSNDNRTIVGNVTYATVAHGQRESLAIFPADNFRISVMTYDNTTIGGHCRAEAEPYVNTCTEEIPVLCAGSQSSDSDRREERNSEANSAQDVCRTIV
jgi:hypothetical protein